MDYGLLTTRFTNETALENKRWRESNEYKGCMYLLKSKISDRLDYNKLYFVLEMNNSINKIMGIGIISIKHSGCREKIYSNTYYNRYMYKGSTRVDVFRDGDYCIDRVDEFIEYFEDPLFRGKGHMKRGQSMTHFPYKKMTPKHIELLKYWVKQYHLVH
jgi:hypothetical protein